MSQAASRNEAVERPAGKVDAACGLSVVVELAQRDHQPGSGARQGAVPRAEGAGEYLPERSDRDTGGRQRRGDALGPPENVLYTVTDKQPVSAAEATAAPQEPGKLTVVYDEDPTKLRFLFEADPRFEAQ